MGRCDEEDDGEKAATVGMLETTWEYHNCNLNCDLAKLTSLRQFCNFEYFALIKDEEEEEEVVGRKRGRGRKL